jgi:uncharacterized protein with NAD-binding domain and iron-sulfur cluster
MAERVIILGGGVGGMSAAHELSERGFEVEVHEPRGVPGGKARSIYVTGTGTRGRPDLPGEHGFRFFPGFYKHLPDTMKRIPYQGKPNGVFDNLVQGSEYLLAAAPDKAPVILVRYPVTPEDWRTVLLELFSVPKLGLATDEVAFFVDRLLTILTTCQERRLAEYEKISWWDFIAADRMSAAYKLYLATGLTRSLVAMRAEVGSTRTVGDIFLQLILTLLSPLEQFDRVLDGPTSEVWLQPWLDYLTARGVSFHFGSTATSFVCAGRRLSGVVVRDGSGAERVVTGDYYIAAMPVERLAPIVSPEMIAADPALGRLGELNVAWMNGFQFFLKNDVPMVHGHANYPSTPWALTSISQAQFWPGGITRYGDGTVQGCLSIDISDWETPGIVFHKPARDVATRQDVATEVLAQLRATLDPERAKVVDDTNIHSWFIDTDIVLPNPAGATVNLEPLLINTADSWKDRPEAASAIENFFIASDFVRTYTDLATMEGANEAARRAVNSILARSGSRAAPCHIWPLEEPIVFLPFQEYDLLRFKLGLPHASAELASRGAPAARPNLTHRVADLIAK